MAANRRVKNYRCTRAYRTLERDMMDSLAARGLIASAYTDKVREYLDLWVQRQELLRDVAERGVSVYNEKSGGMVENRSVSLGVQVSRQMLAIYTALGFKEQTGAGRAAPGDEDEL